MGNSLCKERIERADNSKSPIDRVIGRCAQICPNSFGNNKSNSHYWKNNILETRPPTRTQPKSMDNEWRTATLNTVSQSNEPTIKRADIPIAPPRKKRNTLQRCQSGQPGGFKEVFGTPTRRSSCDSFEQFSTSPKRRNSSGDMQNDDFSDFSKELNNKPAKKAEDLSTTLPKDALDTFVESNISKRTLATNISHAADNHVEQAKKNVAAELSSPAKPAPIELHLQYSKEPERKPELPKEETNFVKEFDHSVESLNKKAEFLMAMLDGADVATNNGKEAQPTEEILTAPKRRRSKNISQEEISIGGVQSPTTASPPVEVFTEIITKIETKNVEHPPAPIDDHRDDHTDLKLEIQPAEKKKEFPKSNPESPNIYAHLQPVEHELIVPVRKVYKHVCDGDDHPHIHGHGQDRHHKHVGEDTVDGPIIAHHGSTLDHVVKPEGNKIQEASPKKPDRDFSRYRKSENLSVLEEPSLESLIESQIIRPDRKKGRSISRDSLPSPPPRPIRVEVDRKVSLQEPVKPVKSRKISLQEPMRGLFEDQKLPDTPVTPINTPILNDNEYEKIETFLKKCSSSQSFLTKELMDQLVDKVYGNSRNWDDQMEEGMLHTKCNDGSEKVGPSSKLTVRKISVIKKDPPKIIQEEAEDPKKPLFSIGTSNVNTKATPPINEEPPSSQPETTPTNHSSHIKRTDTVLELLPESSASKEKKSETSSHPEPEDKKPSPKPDSNPDLAVVNVLLKNTEIKAGDDTNVLESIYKKNQDVMDDFKNYLEDNKINAEMMNVANKTEVSEILEEEVDKSRILFPDHVSVDSFDPADDSDADSITGPLHNKRLAIAGEPRRGSIVEHDEWFLKHRDPSNQGRRGSDCPTYDTRKLFPFGKREKTYSESSDFFDDEQKKSKSSDHINLDSSNEMDHSTLLKYFHSKSLNSSSSEK